MSLLTYSWLVHCVHKQVLSHASFQILLNEQCDKRAAHEYQCQYYTHDHANAL